MANPTINRETNGKCLIRTYLTTILSTKHRFKPINITKITSIHSNITNDRDNTSAPNSSKLVITR